MIQPLKTRGLVVISDSEGRKAVHPSTRDAVGLYLAALVKDPEARFALLEHAMGVTANGEVSADVNSVRLTSVVRESGGRFFAPIDGCEELSWCYCRSYEELRELVMHVAGVAGIEVYFE